MLVCSSCPVMRRLISISLFLALLLPMLTSLAAIGQEREGPGLPICCRGHHGHHACGRMGAERIAQLPGRSLLATLIPCPECPGTVAAHLHLPIALSPTATIFAQISSHPALHSQDEARARISLDRAWRKRGPPGTVPA